MAGSSTISEEMMQQIILCVPCEKLFVRHDEDTHTCPYCNDVLLVWEPEPRQHHFCPTHTDTELVRIPHKSGSGTLICPYCHPPEELPIDIADVQRDVDLALTIGRLAPNAQELFRQAMTIFADRAKKYGTDNIAETGIQGVLARLRDKLGRADSLVDAESPDSMVDTGLDFANYGIILASLAAGSWPKHQDAVQVIESAQDHLHNPKVQGDVGYDLSASERTWCPQGITYVPTGVRIKMPPGIWCTIVGRSSLLFKKRAFVPSCVIDNGYTGEITVPIMNTNQPFFIQESERMAQIIFHKVVTPRKVAVPLLPSTTRGKNGFGSTGS